jgi:hypothetical protein
MRGQNNRAEKPGSIPKEGGHGHTEETPQFVGFAGFGDELHGSRIQLSRSRIRVYRDGQLCRLKATERDFLHGAT